jgi:hypothetical protein
VLQADRLVERSVRCSISGWRQGSAQGHALSGRWRSLMLKFLGIVIAIIFVIGLLVVMGVFKLIF